jgi:hypothetical protein
VAGQRELAPPSNFSKLGGFSKSVFITEDIKTPRQLSPSSRRPAGSIATARILLESHFTLTESFSARRSPAFSLFNSFSAALKYGFKRPAVSDLQRDSALRPPGSMMPFQAHERG